MLFAAKTTHWKGVLHRSSFVISYLWGFFGSCLKATWCQVPYFGLGALLALRSRPFDLRSWRCFLWGGLSCVVSFSGVNGIEKSKFCALEAINA